MKKMLAMILAALMLSAMAVVPAYADTTAAVPAGTDLFLDKNPGLENTEEEGTGGWESSTVWNCLAEHDTADANYDSALGAQYLHFGTDGTAGTTGPVFDGLEGGRHYYLSFYIRSSEKRDDAQIVISYRKNRGDYHKTTDLAYTWAKATELVGLIPTLEADSLKWTKLTYDILVPPNADGFGFTLSLKNGLDLDVDNFSLVAGEYITDNMLKNGNFDAIRGDLDPMYWNANVGSKNVPYATPADGKGGYCFQTTKGGSMTQNVWLVAGKQYKLTFKYKNTLAGTVAFGIDGTYYFGGTDTKYVYGIYHPNVEKWETYSAVFTCPGTAGEYKNHVFYIGMDKSASSFGGTVLFDDVTLVETDAQGVSYAMPEKVVKESSDKRYFAESHVTAEGIYWQRGAEAEEITDFAAASGVHTVKVMGYFSPKAAEEKASLISAVYKDNAGAKQLVSVKVTEVTAADTNPVALAHTIDVKAADASSAWVESFIWTDMAKLAPIANSVYTLGK